MRLKFQKWNYGVTASQTNYLINMRRSSREFDVQDTGSKGIILLVVCGVYAICLFIAARLIGYAASRLTKSVKSVLWRVNTTATSMETNLKELADDDNNNALKMKFKRHHHG